MKLFRYTVFLFGLLSVSNLALANLAPAGEVLLSIGRNVAIDSDGSSRALKRKSSLYPGDRIETASRGRVQIRFSDGSLLSLKGDSSFSVEQYQFDASTPDDGKAVYRLLKGGMRTVTGLIGRKEKEDYRLDTAVATIGIRGTHYTLHLCDAACAQRTQQPEGLFGGVVQGGINVANEAGTYPVGLNDYFHVAERDTPLTPLLAPPELLQDDQEASAEEAEADNDSSAEEEASDNNADAGNDSSADESQTAAATTSDDAGTEPAISSADSEQSGSPGGELGLAEFSSAADIESPPEELNTPQTTTELPATDADTNQTTDTAISTTDSGTTDPGTTDPGTTDPGTTDPGTTVQAPDGAALGVSFIEVDSLSRQEITAGTLITGSTASVLLDAASTAGNIPVSATINDGAGPPPEESCQPCVIDAGSSTLTNVGGASGVGLGINWGRWLQGWSITQNGTENTHLDNLHFIYSPNVTTQAQILALSGVYQFNLLDGTLPTDENDTEGSYLSVSSITVDFDNRMITDLFLNVEADGKLVNVRQLHTLIPLESLFGNDSPPIFLVGSCTGGTCASTLDARGDLSLAFVGANGERIMSSWGIMEDDPNMDPVFSLVGVTAFERGSTALPASTFNFAPPGSALLMAYVDSDGPGVHKGRPIQINADVDTAIVVDTIGINNNVPIYTHFQTTDGSGDITCANCEISASEATLQDTGELLETGQAVNWGRWDGRWAGTSSDPNNLHPFGSLHYIYSESGNVTPDSVVRGLTSTGTVTYNRIGGTLPTDEQGNVGAYGTTTQIGIDFGAQNITSVSMDINVAGRIINVTEAGPVAIDSVLANQPIPLTGICTGGDCSATSSSTNMVGGMGLDFIGPNAERLITNFGLSDDSATPSIGISGAGVYE